MRCITYPTGLGVPRGVDDPHHSQPALDEDAVPKVMLDIFFVMKWRRSTSSWMDVSVSVTREASFKPRGGSDCCSSELDRLQNRCTRHTLREQGLDTMSIANAVRDRRAKSTIVRGSPAYSKQSAGHVEGANRLAAGLLRTYKLKFERKIGRELRPIDPIVPFLVNSVGWMITRRRFWRGPSNAGEVCLCTESGT